MFCCVGPNYEEVSGDCYPPNSLTLNVEFDGDNDVIGDEDESVILITILVMSA